MQICGANPLVEPQGYEQDYEPEIVFLGIPRRRSVSQVLSYAQCGEAYRLERVVKVPKLYAAWFSQGTAVHAVVELWENCDRQMSLTELEDSFIKTYDELIADDLAAASGDLNRFMTGGSKKPQQDIDDRREIGKWQIAQYRNQALAEANEWQIFQVSENRKATELEVTLNFGGVDMIGYIDQIRLTKDGLLIPTDIKTGQHVPPTPFQLGAYRWAVFEATGFLPEYAVFWIGGKPDRIGAKGQTIKGKPAGDTKVDLSRFTRPLLDQMFSQMDTAERSNVYLPNPTESCARTCGVAPYCRLLGDERRSLYDTVFEREDLAAKDAVENDPRGSEEGEAN